MILPRGRGGRTRRGRVARFCILVSGLGAAAVSAHRRPGGGDERDEHVKMLGEMFSTTECAVCDTVAGVACRSRRQKYLYQDSLAPNRCSNRVKSTVRRA